MGVGPSAEEEEQALAIRQACDKGDHFLLASLLNKCRKGPGCPADFIDWDYKNKSTKKCSSAAHYAARNGHDKCLELLIAHGACCNQVDWRGFAPLHENCMGKRKISTCKLLIKGGGCDVNLKNFKDSWTALHICAHDDAPELLEYLLKNGAWVNSKTKLDRATPLHLACKRGHARCMEVLVRFGSDESELDAFMQPPVTSLLLVGFLTEREREREARRIAKLPPILPNKEPDLLGGFYCLAAM